MVIGILDNNGAQVVQYDYDAWGNQTVTDTSGIGLGTKNPFRYRSYFYDTETGLYFLKTRYYDPTTCRFLSRDSVAYADLNTPNGINLYAYCVNNPVNYCDPSGNFPVLGFIAALAITIAGLTAAGAVIGGVSAAVNNEPIGAGIGNGALFGLMLGGSVALIATGIGTPLAGGLIGTMFIGAGVGSIVTLGVNLDSQLKGGGFGSLNIGQGAIAWGLGLGVGALAGGTSFAFNALFAGYGAALGLGLSGKTLFGVTISSIISTAFLTEVGGMAGGFIGGFVGGKLINYLATDSNLLDNSIPMWLVSFIKLLSKFF